MLTSNLVLKKLRNSGCTNYTKSYKVIKIIVPGSYLHPKKNRQVNELKLKSTYKLAPSALVGVRLSLDPEGRKR